MRTVGSASAAPGEIDTGRLAVGETRDGAEFGLPVAVVNGRKEGKTLYLQAVSDGDELNGLGVVSRVVPRLDPTDLAGEVLVVGIANYHAFQVAEHRNPIDDTKLNRTYPGDPIGSASERIADATYEVAAEADLVLDLHQGSTSRMIDEARVRCGRHHRLHDDCLELARVFDTGHVLDRRGPDGQLARVAPDDGIPAIDPELGGAIGWDESSIEVGVRGVFNVLEHYGFLDGDPQPGSQVRARSFERYGAPKGGLVRFTVDLGEEVARGDVIFEIIDAFGSVRARITADHDGVFWRSRRLPQVATGEYVCSIGRGIDTI
ncbi:succinylglutamate desuccinylase/aspartoacylase family protein [Halanaeroarchaeum sulfurireducens]|uniref:Succinylglutamate desuccinylase/aspartoacylase n=1 Tax=Halanaeroarchaeum sulfurireducens TaxID=1604004 RepID=A0A0F7P7R2_9EURY|nr:succinylglutamate desuccinylase/aspartoacylase family protein [Halanaeroarchaeum sulfurireducens]AKH96742.1 succinylglutamate desuccinylase/aspartoacylase [Halanaeroarchaeum sulfurireducens]ALG81144.1 succinylglutamate desuccinylase/aspartoacylase [Halanaeroarchaeum sulfurireducens]